MTVETVHILLLLLMANGTPVVVKMVLQERFNYPLDSNRSFIDGRPFFGHTKTVRGILSSLLITSLCALIIGIPAMIGAIIALNAMLGDLSSSFIKRRLGIPSSKMALGLDQIPESLLPLVAVRSYFRLSWSDVLIIMTAFFILELILSHLFNRRYIKTNPD